MKIYRNLKKLEIDNNPLLSNYCFFSFVFSNGVKVLNREKTIWITEITEYIYKKGLVGKDASFSYSQKMNLYQLRFEGIATMSGFPLSDLTENPDVTRELESTIQEMEYIDISEFESIVESHQKW